MSGKSEREVRKNPQELTSLEKDLLQLEKEFTSVELNQDKRLKVVGCQQRYTGIAGKRSINKGVFWLVPYHRKAKDLNPLEENVLLIHVVSRGRLPLAIFLEESVSVDELINAVLEMQKEEMHPSMERQKENMLILSFAGYLLAPEKEIGPECYSRGATFVLSSSEEPRSNVENHSGHLLFCSDCKPSRLKLIGFIGIKFKPKIGQRLQDIKSRAPSRSKRSGRGWSAGWLALASAHRKMSEREKVLEISKKSQKR